MGTTNVLPQLSAENFNNWKFRVRCLLEEKQLLSTLDEDEKDVDKKSDSRAKSLIVQCITDKHLDLIKDATTTKEMFATLCSIFERKSMVSRIHLRKKLLTLKLQSNEKLEEYFLKFESIIRELENADKKLDEEEKITYLLLGLTENYNTVVTALETMNEKLSLDFVKARLLDEELKNTKPNEQTDGIAFKSSTIICYKCQKEGHKSYECHSNRGRTMNRNYRGRGYRGRSRGRVYHQSQSHAVTTETNQQEFSFLSRTDNHCNLFGGNDQNIEWIIDSGCTEHLIQAKYEKYMSEIVTLQQEIRIYIANGDYVTAKKQGTIKLMCNGHKLTLSALIIDNLSFNLISVKKIVQNNCNVQFNQHEVKICKNNSKDCITGYCKGKLFILKASLFSEHNLCGLSSDSLWHNRLGHVNRYSLKIMQLPVSKKQCGPCMIGKSTRQPFPHNPKRRSSCIGELLHTDVAGPANIKGINEELYYQVIVDDYSHFVVVYLLKSKDEATHNLIKYIKNIENQQNTKVKRIRCDNGGEFKNKVIESFCMEKGINIEYTHPYSPQQNGVSERMNRTLYNKARTQMLETNLPKYLWGEAIVSSAYQLNRCPSSAINFQIPAEVMFGSLDLNRLRVFGSKAWAIQLPRGNKFDKRAHEMRMVGYAPNGYRLWNPKENKIVISRDVRFDEEDIKYIPINEETKKEHRYTYDDENENDTIGCDTNDDIEKDSNTRCDTIGQKDRFDKNQQRGNTESNSQTRPQRTTRKPNYLKDYETDYDNNNETYYESIESNIAYCLNTYIDTEPITYNEAIKNSEWTEAIEKELDAHKKLQTWEASTLPDGHKAIDTRWIFKKKSDGTKKARLVAKGYQENNTYDVYAPVARMSTVRLLISISLQENKPIRQMDIPTAFLNGNLEKEIFIKYPEGVKEEKGKVLKLRKALYGLKEAPRCWNERVHNFFIENNFEQSKHDVCLYFKPGTWALIFVDDFLLMGNFEEIKEKLQIVFKAKDLGDIKEYLGMEIHKSKDTVCIKQEKLIRKILKKFGMEDSKVAKTPMEKEPITTEEEEIVNVPYRELIGSLTYLSVTSRPDITYATSFLSRYLDKPTSQHWKAAKRILRYLKHTINKGLTYFRTDKPIQLITYTDADWGSDKTDRKSVSGSATYFGKNLISWSSKKQCTVSLSSAEAEYIAAASATTELIYLKGILNNFYSHHFETLLLIDNQSAIKIITNRENGKRTKHIDIKYHFIKDAVRIYKINITYVPTEHNVSDIFTKPLCEIKHNYLSSKLNIVE